MTDALNKLIEAVETGKFIHNDAILPRHREGLAAMAFDGDLNAAKGLHEALLPGWEWGRLVSHGTMVVAAKTGRYEAYSADSDNPARAWLIAILRAYTAQQEATP